MARRPSCSRVDSAASWPAMASQPRRPHLVHGRTEGHGTHHVGGSGLLALGRLGPDDLVQVDQVDGAAAGEERVPGGEDAPRPDQRAGTVGGVELVPAEGDEVGVGGECAVRGELRRIEEDRDAAGVRLGADVGHRREPPGHVGRAREGEEGRSASRVEDGRHIVDGERPVPPALDPASLGHPGPGQQVGVVLHHRRRHHVVGLEPEAIGQVVYGFGGIAAEHDDVVTVAGPAGESVCALPGTLVGGRGES